MKKKSKVSEVLRQNRRNFKPVINHDLNSPEICVINFDKENPDLLTLDISDTMVLTEYVSSKMKMKNTEVAIGLYDENRTIYSRSDLFSEEKSPRTIHLGIDIFAASGTPVHAPLDGMVHSFQNNKRFGDYGPTIILEHQLEATTFYTLYGHLNTRSLKKLSPKLFFPAGSVIGWLGDPSENGNWAPHLHFQIITDMLGKQGDFPGVCSQEDRARFLELCPDPNLILNIQALNAGRS
jgi:murein DD-endopeptidase MepM/ murein hydrolase activator NlpD